MLLLLLLLPSTSHESRRATTLEIEAICLLLSRILRVIKKGARTPWHRLLYYYTTMANGLRFGHRKKKTEKRRANRAENNERHSANANWSLQWQFVAITCGAIYI